MTNTKTIKLWFNPDYNLYFPKTPNDCQALMDAGWTNLPLFTPPSQTKPGLNSIDQLYGWLSIKQDGLTYNLKLLNYLPSHVGKTGFPEKVVSQPETAADLRAAMHSHNAPIT